jgi:hypothetical protein
MSNTERQRIELYEKCGLYMYHMYAVASLDLFISITENCDKLLVVFTCVGDTSDYKLFHIFEPVAS